MKSVEFYWAMSFCFMAVTYGSMAAATYFLPQILEEKPKENAPRIWPWQYESMYGKNFINFAKAAIYALNLFTRYGSIIQGVRMIHQLPGVVRMLMQFLKQLRDDKLIKKLQDSGYHQTARGAYIFVAIIGTCEFIGIVLVVLIAPITALIVKLSVLSLAGSLNRGIIDWNWTDWVGISQVRSRQTLLRCLLYDAASLLRMTPPPRPLTPVIGIYAARDLPRCLTPLAPPPPRQIVLNIISLSDSSNTATVERRAAVVTAIIGALYDNNEDDKLTPEQWARKVSLFNEWLIAGYMGKRGVYGSIYIAMFTPWTDDLIRKYDFPRYAPPGHRAVSSRCVRSSPTSTCP